MTLIRKPLRRETSATVFDAGRRLPVCCTLAPEGIYLRQKGRRRAWLLPYDAAYCQAVKLAVAQERREKLLAKRKPFAPRKARI